MCGHCRGLRIGVIWAASVNCGHECASLVHDRHHACRDGGAVNGARSVPIGPRTMNTPSWGTLDHVRRRLTPNNAMQRTASQRALARYFTAVGRER